MAVSFVGSLCVVYQEDRVPSKDEDDMKLPGIIASAIGVGEKRKQAVAALKYRVPVIKYSMRDRIERSLMLYSA